jgi:hypothetical protein
MNQNFFVNEAVSVGINNYLNNSNNNDFITIVIKTLVIIYGELDIINPYKTNTESGLGSFDDNITKFGYSKENLSLFKQNVMNFYLSKNEHPNKYFDKIEKDLIDMFFLKLKTIDKEKINVSEFKNILQFENTDLNKLYSCNKDEIRRYYNFKNKMSSTNITYNIEDNATLMKEAYEMVGYSYDNIIKMNEQQLFDINNKVFEYFNIDQSKEDKYLRLEQAVEYFKDFPKENVKSENGYVEFLLLSGFISVSLLVILIVVGVLTR